MYDSLTDFEKALLWLIQKNAPSADLLVHLDFEHTSRRTGHFSFALDLLRLCPVFVEGMLWSTES